MCTTTNRNCVLTVLSVQLLCCVVHTCKVLIKPNLSFKHLHFIFHSFRCGFYSQRYNHSTFVNAFPFNQCNRSFHVICGGSTSKTNCANKRKFVMNRKCCSARPQCVDVCACVFGLHKLLSECSTAIMIYITMVNSNTVSGLTCQEW